MKTLSTAKLPFMTINFVLLDDAPCALDQIPDFVIKVMADIAENRGGVTTAVEKEYQIGLNFADMSPLQKGVHDKEWAKNFSETAMTLVKTTIEMHLLMPETREIYGTDAPGRVKVSIESTVVARIFDIAFSDMRNKLPVVEFVEIPGTNHPAPRLMLGLGRGMVIATMPKALPEIAFHETRKSSNNAFTSFFDDILGNPGPKFAPLQGSIDLFGYEQNFYVWRGYNHSLFAKHARWEDIVETFIESLVPYKSMIEALGGWKGINYPTGQELKFNN